MPRLTERQQVEAKVGNWDHAFKAIAQTLTPPALRQRFNEVLALPLADDPDNVITYTARMNTAMALGRMVAANDRAAGTIAAMLVATGIKPVSVDYGDDT